MLNYGTLFFIIFSFQVVNAQKGFTQFSKSLTLFAGSVGRGLVDGPLSDAKFTQITDIAFDSSGNYFVVDKGSSVIRKVSNTGIVTTFAGQQNNAGFRDGVGTMALFSSPTGMTIDSFDNLYIADSGNHVIRQITPSGVVTTIAGTPLINGSVDGSALTSTFDNPTDVAIDSLGNIYVTDSNNYLIRKISPAMIISTFVGTTGVSGDVNDLGTAATIGYVLSLVVDSQDNLFFAQDNYIRKVTSASVVSLYAGSTSYIQSYNGTLSDCGFANINAIAIDVQDQLYIAEQTTIRQITSSGVVRTYAGRFNIFGSLDGPTGVSSIDIPTAIVANNNEVIFAESRILRKSLPTGSLLTLSGTRGSSGGSFITGVNQQFIAAPTGSVIDSNGYMFVIDINTSVIKMISPTGVISDFVGGCNSQNNSIDGFGFEACFIHPYDLTIDNLGNIYVTDIGHQLIRKVTPMGYVSTFAGQRGISGFADGQGTQAKFNSPLGIKFDGSNYLYVADTNNYLIRKIDLSGLVTSFVGIPGRSGGDNGTIFDYNLFSATFNSPNDIVFDSLNQAFIVDSYNHVIRKISVSGVVSTFVGNIGQIGFLDGPGELALFNTPMYLSIDSSDNLFVTDSGNHAIRKITPAGDVTTLAGGLNIGYNDGTGSDAYFNNPTGIAIDQSGWLYVADSENHVIRQISPIGDVTTLAGTATVSGSTDGAGLGGAMFNYPMGLAIDDNNNLFVADYGNNCIRKVDAAANVTTFAGSPLNVGNSAGVGSTAAFYLPAGIKINSQKNLFVSEHGYGVIKKITSAAVVTAYAGSSPGGSNSSLATHAKFYNPSGLSFDASGNLFLADSQNMIIRKIDKITTEVTTYAGIPGFFGYVNGARVSSSTQYALFDRPNGLLVVSGGVLVADTQNHIIRQIHTTGNVVDYIGLSTIYGYQNGVSTSVRFNQPTALLQNSKKEILVLDSHNYVIRKVSSSGVVTLFSGQPGVNALTNGTSSTAQFSVLSYGVIDSNDNLFVVDASRLAIRKVTSGGSVSHFAGSYFSSGYVNGASTTARFEAISGIAYDPLTQNLYVSESNYHTIRKVTSAGVVSTYLGSQSQFGFLDGSLGAARFHSPQTLVFDSTNRYLYISDSGNCALRRANDAGDVQTIIGFISSCGVEEGNISDVDFPKTLAMAIDSQGKLYWSTYFTNYIQSYDPVTNYVSIESGQDVAGNTNGLSQVATATLSRPISIDFDSAGQMYFIDDQSIRKINNLNQVSYHSNHRQITGYQNGPVSSATFFSPSDLAIDSNNQIYIADTGNNLIRLIQTNGQVVTAAGSSSVGYVDGVSSAAKFNGPESIVLNATGEAFISDNANSVIRKISLTGEVSTFAGQFQVTDSHYYNNSYGTLLNAKFLQPVQIDFNTLGEIFVADSENCVIKKISVSGVVSLLVGDPEDCNLKNGVGPLAKLSYPSGLVVDSQGQIFVSQPRKHIISKITTSGGMTTFVGLENAAGYANGTGSSAKFNFPSHLAIDSSDNIYVSDSNNHIIRKITSSGVVTKLAGVPLTNGYTDGIGTVAMFAYPNAIAIDELDNLYVSDNNCYIRKVNSTGLVSTIAGMGCGVTPQDGVGLSAAFRSVSGLSVDKIGKKLFIAETHSIIRQLNLSNHSVKTIFGKIDQMGLKLGQAPGLLHQINSITYRKGYIYISTEFGILKGAIP